MVPTMCRPSMRWVAVLRCSGAMAEEPLGVTKCRVFRVLCNRR